MHALYFIEPETGERFECCSSGHWWFVSDRPVSDDPNSRKYHVPTGPALFVSEDNGSKAVRDHQKYLEQGYHSNTNFTDRDGVLIEVAGADDISNYRVVPMMMTPDFDNATNDFRTAAQKRKDARNG